jgi:polysaccharide biosynthesis transport protein
MAENIVDAEQPRREPSIAAVAKRRWAWLTVPTLLAALGGLLWSSLKPPEYVAETTLAVASDTNLGVLGTLAGGLGLGSAVGSTIDMHKELIRSDKVLKEALGSLGISMSWDDFRDFRDKNVAVSAKTGSNVLTLRITRDDPVEAANIANATTSVYLDTQTRLRKEKTLAAADDIDAEMTRVVESMDAAESETRDYKLSHDILDLPTETASAVQLTVGLEGKLREAEGEAAALDSEVAKLRRTLSETSQRSISASTTIKNPVVQDIETRLAQLEVERAGSAAVDGPQSPAIKQLDKEIDEAKSRLRETVNQIVASQVETPDALYQSAATALATAEADAIAAHARVGALRKTHAQMSGALSDVPIHERNLAKLLRSETINLQVYTALLQQYYQLKLTAETTEAGIDVVAEAHPPEKAESRKRVTTSLAWMLLGLGLGIALVIWTESRDPSVRPEWRLDDEYGVPVLAAVPWDGSGGPPDDTTYRESLRPLARRLLADTPADTSRRIVFVGSTAAEGRSTLVRGLAGILAEKGIRTVVVDADLRAPSQHEALGTPREPGLVEAIRDAGAQSVVRTHRICEGLDFVPAGAEGGDPAALLDRDSCARILGMLGDVYRVVLVDCAPASEGIDYALLVNACDTAVVTVNPGRSDDRILREVLWQLSGQSALSVGLVAVTQSQSTRRARAR